MEPVNSVILQSGSYMTSNKYEKKAANYEGLLHLKNICSS